MFGRIGGIRGISFALCGPTAARLGKEAVAFAKNGSGGNAKGEFNLPQDVRAGERRMSRLSLPRGRNSPRGRDFKNFFIRRMVILLDNFFGKKLDKFSRFQISGDAFCTPWFYFYWE